MTPNTICLGPYQFTSPDFPGESGTTFVDNTKTRRIVVTGPTGQAPVPPTLDAIVLYEMTHNDCTMRWYECPTSFGRTYTLIANPCEVFITSFENGFLAIDDCDGLEFGAASFCFGKIHDEEQYDTDECFSSFEFDGHRFHSQGVESDWFGLFDCSGCWPAGFQALEWNADEAGAQELPEPPPLPDEPTEEDEVSGIVGTGDPSDDENQISWISAPSTSAGVDTACNSEEELFAPSDCQSRDNPSIATLPSGHAIIAYEVRNDDGSTAIKLSVVDTTVENKIYYHRSLSRGRLLNDDTIAYGVGTFEVYDDIYIPITNNAPTNTLYLGFLSGPLVGGSLFRIQSAVRELAPDGRYRWSFTFDPGARIPNFTDSNDASDVSFIITESSLSDPTIGDLLTLPAHFDENNKPAPVSNPTIAVAQNAHMIDSSQNIYVAYQAFVNNQWSVFAKHIRLTERSASSPTYAAPYTFSAPDATAQTLTEVGDPTVRFRVIDLQTQATNTCVLFEVFLEDNRQVVNCEHNIAGTYAHPCGLEAESRIASVEVVYTASCPDIPSIGDEVTGPWETLAAATFSSDPACISNISAYPSTSSWCAFLATCTQYFLFDDPYCPSPYVDFIDVEYKPADLWRVQVGDDWVTRVLYNMSATVIQTEETGGTDNALLDFMFVIDHSASMNVEINNVRNAVPALAQSLVLQGFDARFGLTIYARGAAASSQPAAYCRPQTGYIFNAYQAVNPCRSGCGFANLPGLGLGFTSDIGEFTDYLCCWGTSGAAADPWNAIQYAVYFEDYDWRPTASKYMMLVTDTADHEVPTSQGCSFTDNTGNPRSITNVKQDAVDALLDNNIIFLVSCCVPPYAGGTCTTGQLVGGIVSDGSIYIDIPPLTGWTGQTYYDVGADNYDAAFEDIARNIAVQLSGLAIVERDTPGYTPTFIKRAETLITYQGDLLDIWTNDKRNLIFSDVPPVDLTRADKGLSNFPYSVYDGQIYGVDKVHVSANFANWVYYATPGTLSLSYPNIGVPASGRTEPLLIAENARKPRIRVNNRNGVIIAYEKTQFGVPQIHISGTNDLHYGGIIGPKGGRITRMLTESDFLFSHEITLSGEGLNQLVDFVIDESDVCHVVWQSNRDSYWEIYYANSSDLFEPVRVTKAESRSAHPRIDISTEGDIYVVYQDNRFGPFEVFLGYKDERRVIPLLQQDAYLASLRSNYHHFTNLLPVIVSNEGDLVPAAGLLWATKTASAGSGNAGENYIFSIPNPEVNNKDGGGDTSPYEIVAIAGSRDGYMYGVTNESILLQLGAPTEDPYLSINPNDFVELGTINLTDTQVAVDMTIDHVGYMWLAVIENTSICKLLQIDLASGAILRESVLYDDDVTDSILGVTCLNTGEFYFTTNRSGTTQFSKSEYPFLSAGSANFVLEELGDLTPDIQSLASDFEDLIYGLDDLNTIYTISTTGNTTQLVDLTPPEDGGDPTGGADPIQDLSGFGYQFSGQYRQVGEAGYFHVRIEFYDNINLDGNPTVIVDSRDDLEAFINVDFDTGDPYYEDAYFAGAKGVYLAVGESRYIAFDASHFRPGYSSLSYPYAFDTNQTYFPRVFVIEPSGSISLVNELQTTSFSCNRCSTSGDNIFDHHACSFSWVMQTAGSYNFYVDFFGDENYVNVTHRYVATYDSSQLQYFEVNNEPATSKWSVSGLPVGENDELLLQLYPTLDPGTGLVCGVTYYVKVFDADSGDEIEDARGQFFCECSTNIFPNHIQSLSEIGRWHSSAHGYADTRVTDSPQDSMLPTVETRSSGAAIIVFEDRYDESAPEIKAATFRKANPLEFFGSGTKSWFDYDFGIQGQDPDMAIDFYDRVAMTYEREQDYPSGNLPRNSVYYKTCGFSEEGSPTTVELCETEALTSNVITADNFIVSELIKQVLVKEVEYYTYNVAGEVTAVVAACKITLQIYGTPEIVAYRLRNEGNSAYSRWCTANPEITDYVTETPWTLTQGSGIKQVCVQAMTYNGITAEFCVPIVADYATTTFETRFYADDAYSELLPTSDGMYIAATKLDDTTGEAAITREIYLEIVPSRQLTFDSSEHIVNFDVIQQGDNDLFDQIAQEAFQDGRQVFRGSFTIRREDNVLNIDGLARIRVRFADECETETQLAFGSFAKDSLNLTSKDTQVADVVADDFFDPYRQDISGRIGVGMTIRPNEDPYLIFGDPSFYLTQKDPEQQGVAQTDDTTTGTSGSGGSGGSGGGSGGGGG